MCGGQVGPNAGVPGFFTAGRHCLQCNRCIVTAVSVRPSSVTRGICVETNEATIMRFSLSGSKIILVYGEVKIVWKFAGDHPQQGKMSMTEVVCAEN